MVGELAIGVCSADIQHLAIKSRRPCASSAIFARCRHRCRFLHDQDDFAEAAYESHAAGENVSLPSCGWGGLLLKYCKGTAQRRGMFSHGDCRLSAITLRGLITDAEEKKHW